MNNESRFSNVIDPELVASASDGDRDAFSALVARHQSAVCGVAYSVCGEFSTSEDVAQEAFVSAWKQLPELRQSDRFRAWVCGIARQIALSYRRREVRRGDRALSDIQAEPVSTEATPDASAISEEEKALLWRTLDKLPENYREPLVLFYREQQSITAVAAALELSEDTVKQRLSRGRALLREEVARSLENVLGYTRPGAAFTLSVMSALPPVLGVAGVALGTSTAKAAATSGSGGAASTVGGISLAALGTFVSGAMGVLGLYVAYQSWRSSALPASHRQVVRRAVVTWGLAGSVFVLFVVWLRVTNGASLRGLGLSPDGVLVSAVLLFVVFNFALAAVVAFQLQKLHREVRIKPRVEIPRPFSLSKRHTSSWRIANLPLLSIAMGADAERGESHGVAKGWVAVGDVAWGGLVAVGGVAIGPFSMGGVAVGLVSLGGLTAGAVTLGGVALGWLAIGGLAVAWQFAVGGLAVAHHFALGGAAIAHSYADGGYALALQANNAATNELLQNDPMVRNVMAWLPHSSWLSLLGLPSIIFALRRIRQQKPKPSRFP